MTRLIPPVIITSADELESFLQEASAYPVIGVDTESNSLYAYYERVCLIQFSTPHADYIVDPLAGFDLAPLGDLFADPAVQKVFHAAEQDVAGLKRDIGCDFANLFDTMWAARILGWPRVGLANILNERFGVHVSKKYQRHNWGKRPIPQKALEYARLDTHYLLPLRDLQMEELERLDRLEEAAEVFVQLAETSAASCPFEPARFWRIKRVHDLDRQEQIALWHLYRWRNQVAEQQNRPPFKVMTDRIMVALACARPRRMEELAALPDLPSVILRRYGKDILRLVNQGNGTLPPPPPAHRYDEEAVHRYRALRAWRREEAARRGVDTDVILSNAVLWALAERNPATIQDMANVPGLGPWKRETYGRAVLRVLRSQSSAAMRRTQRHGIRR